MTVRALRALRGVTLAVAVVVAVAGCASIPTSGNPTHVDAVESDTSGGYIITPSGPKDGDSAEDILQGFIDAGTGFSNDYAVAREYLSSDFSSRWDPSAGVLVYDGQPTIEIGDDASATVTLSVEATLDADGHLTEMSSNSDIKQGFTLVQQNGQWRIASAPDGVSIIRQRFGLIYTQQTLYFFDPDYAYRVPDVRWIANTPWAATRLVQLLLKGPSSWLSRGVVVSAFPDGTKLSVDTISTSSSLTTVDLSAQALSADTLSRQRMLLQLQSTLSGLSSVGKVQISVNGTVVPVGDLGSDAPVENPLPQDQRLVIGTGGKLAYLSDDGSTEQLTGVATLLDTLAFTGFSIRGSVGAATAADGLWIARDSAVAPVRVATGSASSISIDPHFFTWAVVDGRVRVFGADGTEMSVAMTWIGGEVVSAKLSRDGTRLLLLVRSGSRVTVLASGVIRDKDGKPSELAQPLTLTSMDSDASSLAWYSDQDVAILSVSGNSSTVTVMPVGGESSTKTSTSAASAIAAGPGASSIRLLLSGGRVVALRGSSWLQVATGVSAIGYLW